MAKVQTEGLGALSDEEFMRRWDVEGKRAQELKRTLTAFSQEHQRRNRLAQLHLEPGDLALLQSSTPDGIKSEEQVNG